MLLWSGGWILVCILTTAAVLFFKFRHIVDASTGSAGIGAVSFTINVFVLAILLGPPVVLIAVWLFARLF